MRFFPISQFLISRSCRVYFFSRRLKWEGNPSPSLACLSLCVLECSAAPAVVITDLLRCEVTTSDKPLQLWLGLVTLSKMAGKKGLTSLVLHPLDSGIPYQSTKKTSPKCRQPVPQESHSNHSLQRRRKIELWLIPNYRTQSVREAACYNTGPVTLQSSSIRCFLK